MKPLAFRMRPKDIDEIVGQRHLVGEGKIIRRMVQAKLLSSMILYGPPGTGKTTTVVEAIYETLHRENQVLVCAQRTPAKD